MNRLKDYLPEPQPYVPYVPAYPEPDEGLTPEQIQSLWTISLWRGMAMEWREKAWFWERMFHWSLAVNAATWLGFGLLVWRSG